jgi:hypothetical protein
VAVSNFNFNVQERPEPAEPSRGSSLPDVKNISGLDTAPYLMPRRPALPKSDPFHAEYVDRRPAPREHTVSGRFGRKLDNVPAGTRPTPGSFEHFAATTCHRHPRDRRPEPHARDWSGPAPESVVGHGYGPPVYDGSAATLGMTTDDVTQHGRVLPNFDQGADNG